jgi:selenocysteine lyase/cysteine desulfurase
VKPFDYSTIDYRPKPHAGRWEGGALNVAGVSALGESLRLLLDAGTETVSARVLALTDYLCEKAASAGLEVFSSRRPGDASGIVSLSKPGAAPKELMRRCRDAGVVVNVRAGRLRVSPHAYNTEAEIDRFLEGVT